MPMDIRAYFSKTPPNKKTSDTILGENSKSENTKKKSRKRVFVDSDSDDDSKIAVKKSTENQKKKRSNNDESTSKYFEVSKDAVTSVFGKTPVKRQEKPKAKRKEEKSNVAPAETDVAELSKYLNVDLQGIAEQLASDDDWFPPPSASQGISSTQGDDDLDSPEKQIISFPKSKKKIYEADSPLIESESSGYASQDIKIQKNIYEADSPLIESQSSGYASQDIKVQKQTIWKSPEIKKTPPKTPSSEVKKTDKSKKENVIGKVEPSKPTSFYGSFKLASSDTKKTTESKKQAVSKTPDPSTEVKYQLWVEKYKPMTLKQIIGQQGEKSNVNKLVKWLKNWYDNHKGNKKIPKPSPWAKDDSGAFFKAALLSGPPGVGKTTTAHLVCKELNMDVVEFNASDTRSKKLLHVEVSELLSSKSLSPYATNGDKVSRRHVLVMDEVDGMAGNEDRGGVQELIQLIKTSRVPIICMCNDRNHPKIRSLANYCFDLRFSKPRADQIKGAMMGICFKEGLKIKPDALNDVILSTNQDIRLILNHLSVLSAQNSPNMPISNKYVKLGPWDVVRKVFSESEHKNMTVHDKCDLFFYDYSIAPLFVQENYLNVEPHSQFSKTKKGKMELFAEAATSIACGDLVDKAIRSQSAWSLLPVQAAFSSYIPGEILAGHIAAQINFPSWLGKNSRRGKLDRLAQEIQAHTRLRVSGSKEAINLDYSYRLRSAICHPLLASGTEGVDASLTVLREYSLLREDLDSLAELTAWPTYNDPFSSIESKVKAAFTRAYNKCPILTPFSVSGATKKGRGGGSTEISPEEEAEVWGEEGDRGDEEDETQDDPTKDAMIVARKKQKVTETTKEPTKRKEPGTSKPRGGKKGKK